MPRLNWIRERWPVFDVLLVATLGILFVWFLNGSRQVAQPLLGDGSTYQHVANQVDNLEPATAFPEPDNVDDAERNWLPRLISTIRDTLAQWVMAITGLAALLISGLAAYFLWATLKLDRLSKQAELRAYLGIVDAGIIDRGEGDKLFEVILRNTGSTPAKNVIARHGARALTSSGDFNDPPAVKRIGTVMPGAAPIFNVVHDSENWPETLRFSRSDRSIGFYVFGRITYEDAFGHPRWTEYRLQLNEVGDSIGTLALHICDEGNDYD